MLRKRSLALAILASSLTGSAALAEDSGWRLRVYGFFMETGDTPTIEAGPGASFTSDNSYGAGAGLNAEYRFNRRLGLEIGVAAADHGDFRVRGAGPGPQVSFTDTLTLVMPSAGLNVHLTPDSTLDVYIGPVLALMNYSNLNVSVGPIGPPVPGVPASVRVGVDSDLAFGLNLGMDVPLGETNWILYLNARYLKSSMDASVPGGGVESVDYDPLMLGLGFGYRF